MTSRRCCPRACRSRTSPSPSRPTESSTPAALAWTVYVSNLFAKGQTAPWGGTVWFVLNKADVVARGTVSVDLSYVISVVGALLQNDYGWRDFRKSYWLDSIPFGMEFGPQDGALYGTGPSYFSLRVSSYCLEVGTRLSDAACTQ